MINAELKEQLQTTLETIRAEERGLAEPNLSLASQSTAPKISINWDGLEALATKQSPISKAKRWIERLPDWALTFVVMLAPLLALLAFRLGLVLLPQLSFASPKTWLISLLLFCLIAFSAMLTLVYLRAVVHPEGGRLVPASLVVGGFMFLVMCGLTMVPIPGFVGDPTSNPYGSIELASLNGNSLQDPKTKSFTVVRDGDAWLQQFTVTLNDVKKVGSVVRGVIPSSYEVNKDSSVIVFLENGQCKEITEQISIDQNEVVFNFPGELQAIAQVDLKTTFHSSSLQSTKSLWEKWIKGQEQVDF